MGEEAGLGVGGLSLEVFAPLLLHSGEYQDELAQETAHDSYHGRLLEVARDFQHVLDHYVVSGLSLHHELLIHL